MRLAEGNDERQKKKLEMWSIRNKNNNILLCMIPLHPTHISTNRSNRKRSTGFLPTKYRASKNVAFPLRENRSSVLVKSRTYESWKLSKAPFHNFHSCFRTHTDEWWKIERNFPKKSEQRGSVVDETRWEKDVKIRKQKRIFVNWEKKK